MHSALSSSFDRFHLACAFTFVHSHLIIVMTVYNTPSSDTNDCDIYRTFLVVYRLIRDQIYNGINLHADNLVIFPDQIPRGQPQLVLGSSNSLPFGTASLPKPLTTPSTRL